MAHDKFSNEKEAWDFTWAPQNASIREAFEKNFRQMFPGGHRSSLRDFVRECETLERDNKLKDYPNSDWLREMHPRAYLFLAKYGHDYRPFAWQKWPDFGLGLPESGRCFKNTWRLVVAYNNSDKKDFPKRRALQEIMYVEGLCAGAVCLPMIHAWNSIRVESRVAFDWTHAAACRWDRYFGFPVTESEYRELSEIVYPGKQRYISLFQHDTFPLIESRLVEIAESRILEQKRAA